MRRYLIGAAILASLAAGAPTGAAAQAVKHAFGAKPAPASTLAAAPVGSYAKGCLAGGVALRRAGPSWQTMRPSRNRNWGHPDLVAFVERLGVSAQVFGWPGLLVGDLSQPRGGPMTSGHASHQIGLDADIWMRPGYRRELTRAEREELGSFTVTTPDNLSVNARWTPQHQRILRAAASDPAVARIFVNAAIKDRMCRDAPQADRAWLRKIRPWWGHNAHFHVRLSCPPGAAACVDQAPPAPGDGCDASLAWWFSDEARNPKPDPDAPKPPPKRELILADLPPACAAVLEAR